MGGKIDEIKLSFTKTLIVYKMSNEYSRSFWTELDQLQAICRSCFGVAEMSEIPKDEVISRIEDVIVQIVYQISTSTEPYIQLRVRTNWKNAVYIPNEGLQMCDEPTLKTIAFGHSSTREKFGLIMKVLAKVYKLLQTDQVATKRDLYYEEPQLFKKQTVLDQLVDEIACLLEVPRRWLNVVATSKGCLVGDLTFSGPDAEQVDCSQSTNGVMVPTLVDLVDNFESKTARFILVVEKDATFQRLQDDCFAANMQCIMITGKGVPDVNTRLMIKKMWNALQIPVLGLFDADPHGIEIMCVYRFGSLAQSHDSQSLALPFLKWIGVFPSDIKRLHLPADVVTALTDRAVAKCRDMLTRPYVAHFARLRNELTLMAENRQKAEIQALTRLSAKYLSQVFIPIKIKHGDWI